MAGREGSPAEVPAQTRIVVTRATHCKGVIAEGRYAGRRCGNAVPCEEHDIQPLADAFERLGPDEFPRGYYEYLARERFVPKRPRDGSVLR